MTKQTSSPTRTIDQIMLADCVLSPFNPRAHVTDAEITALAASIRTVGLIQNLSGIANADGTIGIVAGGRRLRALQQIAKEDGSDPSAISVPVQLATSEQEAQTWASAENIHREALHPADEITAYRDLVETSMELSLIHI